MALALCLVGVALVFEFINGFHDGGYEVPGPDSRPSLEDYLDP